MSRRLLARLTLLLGILSLGLAIIPGVVFDEPMPWQRKAARESAGAKVKEAAQGRELKVKVKDVEFSLGKKQPPAAAAADAREVEPESPSPAERLKPYRISAMILGLVGLAAAPFAWPRRSEGKRVVSTGVLLCVLAVTWQYVGMGVMVGVAIVVILIILSNLG